MPAGPPIVDAPVDRRRGGLLISILIPNKSNRHCDGTGPRISATGLTEGQRGPNIWVLKGLAQSSNLPKTKRRSRGLAESLSALSRPEVLDALDLPIQRLFPLPF